MNVWIVFEQNFDDTTVWGVTSTREKGCAVAERVHGERQDRQRQRRVKIMADLAWAEYPDYSSAGSFGVDKWEVDGD